MISPVFKDFKNGKFKIISFYAKKARGMMTRFLLDNDIESADDLKQFDYGGYSFSSEQSEISKELVFTRWFSSNWIYKFSNILLIVII